MTTVLDRIAAYKRREVAERRASADTAELVRRAGAEPTRGFLEALRHGCSAGPPALIAELKKASPSKGLIRADFDAAAIARAYAEGGASCLSVLTDGPSFMGSEGALIAARAAVALPVIRKDFLIDPWQVLESRAIGADAILVILSLVEDALAAELMDAASGLHMDALVEVHDQRELERAGRLGANLIGINNRDLRTFKVDLGLTSRLAAAAPPEAFLVSESGIFTPEDVRAVRSAGAGAVLVGESLMRHADVAAAVRSLLGGA